MHQQFPDLGQDVRDITPAELKGRLDDGEELTVLDTRRPDDFQAWQITHPNLTAVNVPFTEFLDDEDGPADDVPADVPAGPLVASCGKGISSRYVAEFLAHRDWDVAALVDGMEGWAELNEWQRLELDSEVEVVQFHRPSSGCLAYLFISGSDAAVVDPLRAFAGEYADVAREHGATLRYALDTHVHADHVSGVREVAAQSDATVVVPAGAADRGLAFDATLIESGETLALGETEIEAVGLPGHTTEMLGYRCDGAFTTGDTLFLDGVARPDLEDEDAAREAATVLWETLQSLDAIPDDVVIGPGHVGPTTAPDEDGTFSATLGDLRARLRAFDEPQEEFVDRVTHDLPPRPANFEEIIDINLGREQANSEEAFELELGPNNCAVAE